jgi:MFS family permease
MLIGWAVGAPVFGALSDRIGRRKPLYVASFFGACIVWGIILFVPQVPIWLLTLLSFTVGFLTGAQIIGFAFVKESVPLTFAGTVTGVCNMGYMIGPMVLQPLMGWVLDRHWTGGMENGVKVYPLEAYHFAFGIMMIGLIIAVILSSFTTETRCQQKISSASAGFPTG